jgi:hypothetical protein
VSPVELTEGRGEKGVGGEPNHMTTRKPDLLNNSKLSGAIEKNVKMATPFLLSLKMAPSSQLANTAISISKRLRD